MAWVWGSVLLAVGGELGKCFLGETSPSTVPPASQRGVWKFPSTGKKKIILPPRAGIDNWAVIFSLPPSILPSSPSSILLTPNPELEALPRSAMRAGGTEHLVLPSGDLNRCRGRRGSQQVLCAAVRTLSRDFCPALAPCYRGGMPFCWAP